MSATVKLLPRTTWYLHWRWLLLKMMITVMTLHLVANEHNSQLNHTTTTPSAAFFYFFLFLFYFTRLLGHHINWCLLLARVSYMRFRPCCLRSTEEYLSGPLSISLLVLLFFLSLQPLSSSFRDRPIRFPKLTFSILILYYYHYFIVLIWWLLLLYRYDYCVFQLYIFLFPSFGLALIKCETKTSFLYRFWALIKLTHHTYKSTPRTLLFGIFFSSLLYFLFIWPFVFVIVYRVGGASLLI